jgi:hypothetical protein
MRVFKKKISIGVLILGISWLLYGLFILYLWLTYDPQPPYILFLFGSACVISGITLINGNSIGRNLIIILSVLLILANLFYLAITTPYEDWIPMISRAEFEGLIMIKILNIVFGIVSILYLFLPNTKKYFKGEESSPLSLQ